MGVIVIVCLMFRCSASQLEAGPRVFGGIGWCKHWVSAGSYAGSDPSPSSSTDHNPKSTGSLITVASNRRGVIPAYLNQAHCCCGGEKGAGSSSLDHL
ncbi:hypothetical protein EDB89DRAFT_1954294 [Lactarius sanguifluus]|nr:hypothetical protein EDB89DRAFT_1954294 [Lactarius sanguifluus]